MNNKIKVALIAGACSIIASVITAFGTASVIQNENAVTVNINGEKLSVTLDEYAQMYDALKNDYDALATENQILKKEGLGAEKSKANVTTEVQAGKAYIGEQISAYYHNSLYYKEYASLDTESFSMGKQPYTRGFTIGASEEYGTAYYNLGGKYTTFSGLVGNLDNVNQGAAYGVYGDDMLLATIEVVGAALPKAFSIDVTGVRQLKILCGNKNIFISGFQVGFADVVFE